MEIFKNKINRKDISKALICDRCDEKIHTEDVFILIFSKNSKSVFFCTHCIMEVKNELIKKIEKFIVDCDRKIIETELRDIQTRLLDCQNLLRLINNCIDN